MPYSFFTRYGEKPGTNPEELLGAAHAACSTMSFVRMLGMANFVPEQVDSKSDVVIEKDGTAFPSPRSISPSRRRYRALTAISSSRSRRKQRRGAPSPS